MEIFCIGRKPARGQILGRRHGPANTKAASFNLVGVCSLQLLAQCTQWPNYLPSPDNRNADEPGSPSAELVLVVRRHQTINVAYDQGFVDPKQKTRSCSFGRRKIDANCCATSGTLRKREPSPPSFVIFT